MTTFSENGNDFVGRLLHEGGITDESESESENERRER